MNDKLLFDLGPNVEIIQDIQVKNLRTSTPINILDTVRESSTSPIFKSRSYTLINY